MSHALPAPLYDLDAKRILATAATIAIHVLALMLLLAPMEWTPPVATVEVDPQVIFIEEKKIKPIDPPPLPIERPREVTTPRVQRTPAVEEHPVISDETGPMATAVEEVQLPVADTFDPPPSGPVALAVLQSPPPIYPSSAIRMGITGRVVLRIEVDATGRAVSGVIEQSSGSTILDNAALKVVLAKWRFVPAQHAGQNIAATALVPIVFSLD
jgi:protein TonB